MDSHPRRSKPLYQALKPEIRQRIFFLLFFYEELNVSEIAHKLHASKATVSRHLLAMEQDHLVESRVSPYKRSITPRFYRLPIPSLMAELPFESRAMEKIPKDSAERLEHYEKAVNAIRSSIYLTQKGLNLLHPLLDNLEASLSDIKNADPVFQQYFSSSTEKKMDFQTIILSENVLPEYFKLWMKFRKDVEALEKANRTDHSYIVFETVLPFRKLIEFPPKS